MPRRIPGGAKIFFRGKEKKMNVTERKLNNLAEKYGFNFWFQFQAQRVR